MSAYDPTDLDPHLARRWLILAALGLAQLTVILGHDRPGGRGLID